MNKEELEKGLRLTEEKYKNKLVLADVSEMSRDVLEVLKNCIEIPEEATRADVFEIVFGYAPARDEVLCNIDNWCGASEPCNYCINNSNNIGREGEWWNAPYQKGEEE